GWWHLRNFFGEDAKAVATTTDRMQQYIRARQREGAATATINIELALIGKAFTLAVLAKRLRAKPYVPKLAPDPSRVRRGFFHREGKPVGDFRKVWDRACTAIGLSRRIVHDLRRSGVRHLIRAGVPPHTVMAMSGHRTASMLKRYDIISLDDLRQAARRGSE